jgi:hypothetical protein
MYDYINIREQKEAARLKDKLENIRRSSFKYLGNVINNDNRNYNC